MGDKGEKQKPTDNDRLTKENENTKSQGAVSKRPPLSRRPDNSSLPLYRQTSAKTAQGSMSKASSSSATASSSARQFKKCMSATFEIDGHYYTIGRYVC